MNKFEPRNYQTEAINHLLANKRCGLFAEMGLGKTVSTLTAISVIQALEGCKVLIVAPLRVAKSTWPEEIAKWDHLKHLSVSVITGTVSQRDKALSVKADIYTTNYENIPWLVGRKGYDWDFDLIVCDESTKLKSFRLRQGTKRAKWLAKVAHKTDRFVLLTGTPSPNGLQDLWGQQWFIDKGSSLGSSFTAFEKRWFTSGYGDFAKKIPLPHAHDEISGLLNKTTLTLRANDYFNLDKPIINNIYVNLPAKSAKLYKEFEKQMFSELESGEKISAANAAAKTIKCLQLANGAVYVGENQDYEVIHDEKIQALESIVEEACGMPVLVAYHFKSDLYRLLEAFPSAKVLDKNTQTIDLWNRGEIPILLVHPASAGHGLNLQHGGNILAIFGHWWNLEEYQQVVERIGVVRQKQSGYDRPVFIHNILTRGTIDELVVERRESKRDVQDLLMEKLTTLNNLRGL